MRYLFIIVIFSILILCSGYSSLPSSIIYQDSDGNTALHLSLVLLGRSTELNSAQEGIFDLLSTAAINTNMEIVKKLCFMKNKKDETILDLIQQVPDYSISKNEIKAKWIKLWNIFIQLSEPYTASLY